MARIDEIYANLVENLVTEGSWQESRSGEVRESFGGQYEVDLTEGFPILTTKKVYFNSVMYELNWMLRGETNIGTLGAPKLWEKWADEDGELGNIYGAAWRRWGNSAKEFSRSGFDQLNWLIGELKYNPRSRRLILSAWDPIQAHEYPGVPNACHTMAQFYVYDNVLSCHLYQRSADLAIGVPFNIAQYALLTHMLAKETGKEVGRLIHSFGSIHIYSDHYLKLLEQIQRVPFPAPRLEIADKSFWDLISEDSPKNYKLVNYQHHDPIKYELAK